MQFYFPKLSKCLQFVRNTGYFSSKTLKLSSENKEIFYANLIKRPIVQDAKPAISKQLKQILLTVEELDSDITTVLTTYNPYFNENTVEYNYKQRAYVPLTTQNKSIFFYDHKGNIRQRDTSKDKVDAEKKDESVEELDTKRKNKFNFCDRSTQTANSSHREKGEQTETSPQLVYEDNASLACIVSAYEKKEESIALSKEETDLSDTRKPLKRIEKGTKFSKHRRFLRLCERMVDQNLLCDVNIDYSFYDTPSDEFKEKGLGSLLVLWKFNYHPMKKMAVTSLSWNSLYPDMFATSFGSYDISTRGNSGCICVFSLKCPSFPEKVIFCQSGVFCVQFSSICPYLLAAGFADGTVAVYDVRSDESSPAAINKNTRLEHNDIVYQVKWLADNVDGNHNFCSISADNRLINWLLAKTELIPSEILNLQQGDGPASEMSLTSSKSHGTCISFHPTLVDFFLIGTESGVILKCSNSSIAHSFTDHSNCVYSVHWNPYHPRVFLSCSADWTIRIWDHTLMESIFTFDLLNEVKDVSWAPFSSTLFAAVTNDGKVHIFDIMMNKQQPTSSYLIYNSKKKVNLTSVQFNPAKPVIIIGDDRGSVISFKLSPNLRSSLKAFETMERSKFEIAERDKMEKILKLSKNPDNVEI